MAFMNGNKLWWCFPVSWRSVIVSWSEMIKSPNPEMKQLVRIILLISVKFKLLILCLFYSGSERLLAKSAVPKPEWNWLRSYWKAIIVVTETMIVEFKHIETMTLLICWGPHKEHRGTALHVLGAASTCHFLFVDCMRFFSFGEKTSNPCHSIIVHITQYISW